MTKSERPLMDENTVNPTMDDICLCPFCDNETFYSTDYGREFCSKCLKEVRVNENFKEGRLTKKEKKQYVHDDGSYTNSYERPDLISKEEKTS